MCGADADLAAVLVIQRIADDPVSMDQTGVRKRRPVYLPAADQFYVTSVGNSVRRGKHAGNVGLGGRCYRNTGVGCQVSGLAYADLAGVVQEIIVDIGHSTAGYDDLTGIGDLAVYLAGPAGELDVALVDQTASAGQHSPTADGSASLVRQVLIERNGPAQQIDRPAVGVSRASEDKQIASHRPDLAAGIVIQHICNRPAAVQQSGIRNQSARKRTSADHLDLAGVDNLSTS